MIKPQPVTDREVSDEPLPQLFVVKDFRHEDLDHFTILAQIINAVPRDSVQKVGQCGIVRGQLTLNQIFHCLGEKRLAGPDR